MSMHISNAVYEFYETAAYQWVRIKIMLFKAPAVHYNVSPRGIPEK
jgi:hypothetical protein